MEQFRVRIGFRGEHIQTVFVHAENKDAAEKAAIDGISADAMQI